MIKDDVSLVIGNQKISGWTRIRITCGIERLPREFDIELTEYYPGVNSNVVIQPGQPCQVLIGGDIVITGYIDRYMPLIEKDQHGVRVSGRGKCEDLVDCSAEWPLGQISGTSALDIAKKLSKPYGIDVKLADGVAQKDLKIIPQFNIMYGETPGEIIERVTRYSGLLYYDLSDGNLLLARAGEGGKASSGFQQGKNVERASATLTMDERFSEYQVMLQPMATLGEFAEPGELPTTDVLAHEFDKEVPRHRKKFIICEAGAQGQQISNLRAAWEKNRRYGRSFEVDITVDSWRDSEGKLWTVNTLAPIDIPAIKVQNKIWVISEVNYMRDENNGTTARLVLMPKEAFQVEPVLLIPITLPELAVPGGNYTPRPAPAAIPGPTPFSGTDSGGIVT